MVVMRIKCINTGKALGTVSAHCQYGQATIY